MTLKGDLTGYLFIVGVLGEISSTARGIFFIDFGHDCNVYVVGRGKQKMLGICRQARPLHSV